MNDAAVRTRAPVDRDTAALEQIQRILHGAGPGRSVDVVLHEVVREVQHTSPATQDLARGETVRRLTDLGQADAEQRVAAVFAKLEPVSLPPPSGNGRSGPAGAGPLTPWDHAESAPTFLAAVDAECAFLEDRILVRGAVTELFSPRGLGKTHVAHALAVKLAGAGHRVLLLDRDNPPREIRRRLKGWNAATAPTLEVLSRNRAPALTDSAGWASFPADRYDVLIIDSLDATTEGVGEQDSSRPSRALATLLDIARRPKGPAVLALGNTVKSAAHSRGSGVVEDRADVVFEVRDATDFRPSGGKPWWEELPPAGAEAWAQRASRRKRRAVYRLALVPSKFRVGEEPDPFVLAGC